MSLGINQVPGEDQSSILPPANLIEQLRQKKQLRQQQETEEVAVAQQALDKADQFDANAQLVEQEAQSSRQAAQDIRSDVQQAETLRQEQEVADDQELLQAQQQEFQRTFVEKRTEIAQDLAVMTGIEPNVADQALGEILEQQVIDANLRLNENSERVVKIKEKIAKAEQLTTADKVLTTMAILAPVIAGLATGRVDRGLQASGVILQQFGQQFQERGAAARAELSQAEKERVALEEGRLESVEGLIDLQEGALDRLGKVDSVIAGRIDNVGKIFSAVKSRKDAEKAALSVKKELKELKDSLEGKKKTRKLTESEKKDITFGIRLMSAEEVFTELEAKNWTPTRGEAALARELQTDDRQKYDQAVGNFLNAILRRESGAAISESEFERGNLQYFPQPGDSAAVARQKKRNRMDAMSAIVLGLEEEVQQARQSSARRIQELEAELKRLKEAK